MTAASSAAGLVTVGRVVGLFGLRGWVKVFSYCRPPEAILAYDPWHLRVDDSWRERALLDGKLHGRGIVASLDGCADRTQACALVGADVAVDVAQLAELPGGEYYWAQLQGLRVVNLEGSRLGVVSHLLETGANDVMVVTCQESANESTKRGSSRLIPYIRDVVKSVNLDTGVILVDWDASF
ncbi:MAG: ribosome maturation factor RimM [Gammaproteobacteria bacterium]|nr:MAG: ribosome maturation factor RimM [Gammaproteobacteria bacterium]